MSRDDSPFDDSSPSLEAAIPALPTSDVPASVEFYEDLLDFDVVHQEDEFAMLRRDDVEIHLWGATDEDWRTREGGEPVQSGAESFIAGTASCRVRVQGIRALHDRLEPRGVLHPNGPLRATDYGTREFTVVDPDNNVIAFFEPM